MVYGNQNHNRSPNTDRWWVESQRTLDAITGRPVAGDTDPAPVSPVAEPARATPNPIKLRDAVLMMLDHMPDPPATRTGPSIVGNGDDLEDIEGGSADDFFFWVRLICFFLFLASVFCLIWVLR